ncbi:MAG TPA: DNA primase [Candidatus Paceibacterota bacterium]|nr:DNA primase [Candidatus Paceibacterota bacterium]
MPSSTTELIKSKLDIVDFLRGYLTLTPAGKNFKALCPFHHEKSPSFSVSPERQRWHCFGCGADGDIFGFVMKYENMEFGEALRMLAEKAGVELRHENPAEYRYTGLLYDLNDQAKNFYKRALAAAPIVKQYLAERGLAPSIIEEFELGWAANEPENLSMHLLNGGAAPQDLLQAGLSIKSEKGMMFDRFRGRVMFPIHNHLGKVVGFTGRILPQFDTSNDPKATYVTAKYVNSPETPIFQKSRLLYGFWKSKDAIREAKSAVLVEGQMDFLMSYQSGVRNVIASSGTALTADHLRSVRRLADEVILCFDSDAAGSDAAERAIDLAEANDFAVKVATYRGFKDAAEAAKADPENVRKTVAAAVTAPVFYFEKYLPPLAPGAASSDPAALTTREGLGKLRTVLAKLRHIASPVERDHWMKELAKRTGVAEKTLEEEAEKSATAQYGPTQPSVADRNAAAEDGSAPKRQVSRQELIVEDLLALALARDDFSFMEDCETFLTPPQKEIFALLKGGARKSDDAALDAVVGLIVLRDPTAMSELKEEDVAALKEGLAREYYKERRHILSLAIKNAEARGNDAELAAALAELAKLPGGEE